MIELVEGARHKTQGRTITEADIVAFAGLSGDFTPIHVDAAFAATTPHGERVAHGPLVLSTTVGMATHLGIFGDRVIGLVNLNWDFQGGVRIGDTVHGEVEITEIRRSSKPGRGVATYTFTVVNQHGETVQTGRLVVVVRMD
jgi:acyl dehydratase